jgi:hypothetical protein
MPIGKLSEELLAVARADRLTSFPVPLESHPIDRIALVTVAMGRC